MYSDFSASFYFPQDTAVSKIAVSNGLNYYISAANESLEIAVQGFNVATPEILVNYKQVLEIRREKALPGYLIAAAVLIIAVLVLVRIYKREEEAKEAIPQISRPLPLGRGPPEGIEPPMK